MVIEIMSALKLLNYTQSSHNENAAVISISNYGEEFVDVRNNPKNGIEALCQVHFNDVEAEMRNCMTDRDAANIASFVKEVSEKKDRLIVQCGYGVSRSAGVAAAILMHLTGNDSEIWRNPKYRPNITCYRKMMTAFHEVIDEQELKLKVAVNRRYYVWADDN